MAHDGTELQKTGFAHVLHPTDLTPEGEVAFAHGLKLAVASRADLSLVHTSHTASLGNEWRAFPRVREHLVRWGVLPEGASQQSVGETLGVNVHKADLDGRHPAEVVAAYGERYGCDLVVLATHARHGVEAWIRPSVAEPMARAAQAPTLFLPGGAAGFVDPATGAVDLRSILIPVDTRPDPRRAVALAVRLARLLGAQPVIHLLHVGATHPVIPADLLGGLEVKWRHEDGAIVDVIHRVADEVSADLIVMATAGHDGFLDALRGSTTEQVLRKAGRALLAAP